MEISLWETTMVGFGGFKLAEEKFYLETASRAELGTDAPIEATKVGQPLLLSLLFS